jgi:ABC-2 type transport system ATP-binding protein
MIEIKNLTFGYRRSNPVLEGVKLSITEGIHTVLGENGVGKTTLLHLISTLCIPDSGSCLIRNMNTASRSPELLSELFFLPEELQYPTSSMAEFVRKHSKFYPHFHADMLLNNLKDMGINSQVKLSELSFGQKKKALLAYSLALQTPVLLLDEPTNGLDMTSKQKFQKLLAQSVSDGQTVLISTHTVSDFKNLVDGVIFIVDYATVVFARIEEISSQLLFVKSTNKPETSLYCEQDMAGYSAILKNNNRRESIVDIELLYRGMLKSYELRDTLQHNENRDEK